MSAVGGSLSDGFFHCCEYCQALSRVSWLTSFRSHNFGITKSKERDIHTVKISQAFPPRDYRLSIVIPLYFRLMRFLYHNASATHPTPIKDAIPTCILPAPLFAVALALGAAVEDAL